MLDNIQYKNNSIIFNSKITDDKKVREFYRSKAEELNIKENNEQFVKNLTDKKVDKAVISIIERRKDRVFLYSGHVNGVKGIFYKIYGEKVWGNIKIKFKLLIEEKYKRGWNFIFGEDCNSIKNFFTESFSAYCLGEKTVVNPEIWNTLKNMDQGILIKK